MGRIGRLLFRRLVHHPDIELVAVNDIMTPDNLLYLLKYDSVYGTWPGDLHLSNGGIVAGDPSAPSHPAGKRNKAISCFQIEDPAALPWKKLGVDVVLECSGKFTNMAGAQCHLNAGAGKVLLSTTGSTDIPLLIYGFNHHQYAPGVHIVSPGGCMTNCATHLIYILNAIGVQSVQVNVLHSYTSRQELVDAPRRQFRRGRAAAESIIPVEVDLFQSLGRLFPLLRGKICTLSTRVPVANGAMADFTFQLAREVNRAEINHLFMTAAHTEYNGIIEYTEEQLVSGDIKGNSHSCVIDGSLTAVTGNHLKLIAWFDNEYGFTSRMIDWLQLMKGGLKDQ